MAGIVAEDWTHSQPRQVKKICLGWVKKLYCGSELCLCRVRSRPISNLFFLDLPEKIFIQNQGHHSSLLWQLAENWEVQGLIPSVGKTLTPELALISHLLMSMSVREVFRLINLENKHFDRKIVTAGFSSSKRLYWVTFCSFLFEHIWRCNKAFF